MDIRMYNVGYGECFLIRDEKANLLVDFGSDTPCILSKVADKLELECKDKEVSILLTHFHDDHINGFLYTDIHKRIDIRNIYLPDMFQMIECEDHMHRFNLAQIYMLLDINESVKQKTNKIIEPRINKLLKRLCTTGASIKTLSRRDEFNIPTKGRGKRKFIVLWPCYGEDGIKASETIKKAFITIWKLISRDKYQYNEINDLSSETQNEICKEMKKVIDNASSGCIEFIKEFYNEEYYKCDKFRYENAEISTEDVFLALSRLEWDELHDYEKKEIKENITNLNRLANRASIVFHEEEIEGVSNLLMTGDIDRRSFQTLVYGELKDKKGCEIYNRYRVIKAPHHGTDTHFTPYLPKCSDIMVSNGETHIPNRGKISHRYGIIYSKHRDCNIICINNRCELKRKSAIGNCSCCPGNYCYRDNKCVLQ